MVNEYQDTNYIQEQLLLRLASKSQNICVVGDEVQSLDRFRGATVRNILEFSDRVPGCQTIKLITNYRSHRQIATTTGHGNRNPRRLVGSGGVFDDVLEFDSHNAVL